MFFRTVCGCRKSTTGKVDSHIELNLRVLVVGNRPHKMGRTVAFFLKVSPGKRVVRVFTLDEDVKTVFGLVCALNGIARITRC